MAAEDGEDAFFDQFREEYDSFFAEESTAAPTSGTTSRAAPTGGAAAPGASCEGAAAGAEVADIESEYEVLSTYSPDIVPNGSSTGSVGHRGSAEEGPCLVAKGHGAAATFSMADDDDCEHVEMDMVHSSFQQDLCLPELPPAPPEFSCTDLAMREALAAFYTKHCVERLPGVNAIVARFRGRSAAGLWAQLALKYSLQATEAVELLAGTLYLDSAFEYSDQQRAAAVDEQLGCVQLDALAERPELLRAALAAGAPGAEELVRALCFRGLPGDISELRPRAWKVLLGYLPMARHSEWAAIEAERRALYATYRSEVLVVTSSHKIEVKVEGHRAMKTLDVLQQIQKDVDRTRHESDCFRRPAARAALSALLFVYAHRNPDIQYLQGMNEVAALLFYVFSVDPEFAEADTFWCFSAVMQEIKAGLMQALEPSDGSGAAGHQPVPAPVASVERLLKAYDPELSRHLQRSGCPMSIFTFRWCTLLFAQDAALPDAVSIWESLIADPHRFDFVVHVCLALLLAHREELLGTHEEGAMAEVLRGLPRRSSAEVVLRLARAICAFERRPQTPPFPVRSAAQLVQDLSGWAQKLGAGVARSLQDSVSPVVKDKAGQAAGTAAAAAQGGAQAVKSWLEQPAPLQPQTFEKATAQVASLWQVMRSKGAAAVSKTKELAAEYGQSDKRPGAGIGAANSSASSSFSTLAGPSGGYHYQMPPQRSEKVEAIISKNAQQHIRASALVSDEDAPPAPKLCLLERCPEDCQNLKQLDASSLAVVA